jgi:hypothetical protein
MKRRLLLSLLLLLAGTSLRADWRVVRDGIEYQHVVEGAVDAHVVRVDLRNPDLRVIATDANDRGRTVAAFAARNRAIVAINGDYFTTRMETIGLAAGACGVWAKPKKTRREPLLAIGEQRAEIDYFTKPRSWMTGAVAGWPMLIEGCAVRSPLPGSDAFTRMPHARTAVGLTADEQLLIVTTRPATLPALAQFLQQLGACRAINFDGGRSTGMWLDGALLPGSGGGAVANHLGVIDASDYSGCQQRKQGTRNP